MRVLQVNLNRCWAAQNLLMQNIAENNFDLACISEPASIPRSPHWFASTNGLAAIYLGAREFRSRCVLYKIGRNYIVIKCDSFYFFSVYISPSESNLCFHNSLDELDMVIRAAGGRCIVTGDFNAKSTLWGGRVSDWRGSALERWAAGLNLRLVNTRVIPTCVRDNGSSVVDLTWSSADVSAKFADWRPVGRGFPLGP